MTEYSQLVLLPILAGPYNQRRRVRHRPMARQIGIVALVTTAGALFALAF